METKRCTKCRALKPVREFRKRSDCAALESWCKSCVASYRKEWGHTHKRRVSAHKSLYKSRAKRDGVPFALPDGDFEKLIAMPCHYCGQMPFEQGKDFAGIDRLDNSLGYVFGNVVPCCWACNRMKGDTGVAEFLARVRAIVGWTAGR